MKKLFIVWMVAMPFISCNQRPSEKKTEKTIIDSVISNDIDRRIRYLEAKKELIYLSDFLEKRLNKEITEATAMDSISYHQVVFSLLTNGLKKIEIDSLEDYRKKIIKEVEDRVNNK